MDHKDCCVVNVATPIGWYPKGQKRLRKSLEQHSPDIDFISWSSTLPSGCPPHEQIPYAFKPYAFKEARDRGYKFALWLDAAAWAVRDIMPVFEDTERDGCYLQHGGFTSGQWCSDAALGPLGITREESFEMGHLAACIMGLDLKNETSNKFLDRWLELADDGVTFPGAWRNTKGKASSDPRVLGHRHDQTAASVISIQMGMKWTNANPRLKYKLPNVKPVEDYVCFLSAGM